MSETEIFKRFEQLECRIARLLGDRLSRERMCERLQISGKTLTDRVRRKVVPSPGEDGKWLLSEVMEWESRQATSDV